MDVIQHRILITNTHVAQTGDEEDIETEDVEDGSDQDSDDAMDDLAIVDG